VSVVVSVMVGFPLHCVTCGGGGGGGGGVIIDTQPEFPFLTLSYHNGYNLE